MYGMLLCAGFGTRFRPLTDKMAKPAIPFLGLPLCGYPLFYLEQAGLTDLVVNTHHLPDTMKAAVAKVTDGKKYSVKFSDEKGAILGSGGGIYNARKLLAGADDFIVINGDEVFFPTDKKFLKDVLAKHKANKALATLVTCDQPGVGRDFNAVRVVGGAAKDIGVRYSAQEYDKLSTKAKAELKHFSGIFIFSKRIFDFMPMHGGEFHIFKDCLTPAIARGEKVLAHHMEDLLWFEMSSEEAYLDSTACALHLLESDSKQAKVFKEILESKA